MKNKQLSERQMQRQAFLQTEEETVQRKLTTFREAVGKRLEPKEVDALARKLEVLLRRGPQR